MTTETLLLLVPEIVLVVVAVAMYVAGAFVDAEKAWAGLAGGAVLLAAAILWGQSPSSAAGPIDSDALAYFARWFALVFGGLFVLLASQPPRRLGAPEYVGSLLLVIVGLMLTSVAADLVLLFVALELISIPTYILLALGRGGIDAQESTAKYFFLSVLSSAVLLYGFTFLYGMAGSTQFSDIRAAMFLAIGLETGPDTLLRLALVFVLAGLAFKIAAVPFHFYAPDVYQGTTDANAALLSVVPKAAGMVVLVRLLTLSTWDSTPYGWRTFFALAVVTMTLGNVVALWQTNLRRLLAYSSIAHAGYMLIGLTVALAPAEAAQGWDGISALLFYLGVYGFATLGTFAALSYLAPSYRQLEAVDELAGLARTRPWVAAALGLFMFSLAGIPPLAGFWGKVVLFGSALSVDTGMDAAGTLRPWFIALAVIGAVNAAIAAAYYLRIIAVMYFRSPTTTLKAEGGAGAGWALAICATLVVLLGLFPEPLRRGADQASPTAIAADAAPEATVMTFDIQNR